MKKKKIELLGKPVTVVHFNVESGYISYLEEEKDEKGNPTYKLKNMVIGDAELALKPKKKL